MIIKEVKINGLESNLSNRVDPRDRHLGWCIFKLDIRVVFDESLNKEECSRKLYIYSNGIGDLHLVSTKKAVWPSKNKDYLTNGIGTEDNFFFVDEDSLRLFNHIIKTPIRLSIKEFCKDYTSKLFSLVESDKIYTK
mgnify:CR=1 FL=1